MYTHCNGTSHQFITWQRAYYRIVDTVDGNMLQNVVVQLHFSSHTIYAAFYDTTGLYLMTADAETRIVIDIYIVYILPYPLKILLLTIFKKIKI